MKEGQEMGILIISNGNRAVLITTATKNLYFTWFIIKRQTGLLYCLIFIFTDTCICDIYASYLYRYSRWYVYCEIEFAGKFYRRI